MLKMRLSRSIKYDLRLRPMSLSGVKNVRNVTEFNTLGQAATARLNPAATDKDFTAAIDTLSNRYLDAQATTELSVGHKLTGKLVEARQSAICSHQQSRMALRILSTMVERKTMISAR